MGNDAPCLANTQDEHPLNQCHDELMARQIVFMGSGETSPTMVTPHQNIQKSLDSKAQSRVVLDTPFGFQENADDLTTRLVDYFANSVGVEITSVRLRRPEASASEVAQAVASVMAADWVFAGPGSPSYALRTWKEVGLAPHLDDVLKRGTLVLASAAALTAGAHTLPVYEIYKVGEDPYWLDGLDILGRHTGLRAAVIPHFDNAEGGNHDTRYCYMGETRLRILEAQLPSDVFILGIDEHTGVAFDLDSRTVNVFGRGSMTVRKGEHVWAVKTGGSAHFDELAHFGGLERRIASDPVALPVDVEQVEELLETGNVMAAVDALLELDDLDRDLETRATVHALITRLGHLAASPRVNIESVIGPYVEALLQARMSARSGGRWDEADAIRDKLTSLQVTIRDSQDGSTWDINSS